MEPAIYIIKPEQVGGRDVSDFLRQAIATEFSGKEYMIVNEQTLDKPTSYSKTPRKIRIFSVQEGLRSHAIFFDITEVSAANQINWLGSHA